MDNNNNRGGGGYNEHLGVNKLGKNIKKTPLLHQQQPPNTTANKPPQPHVYNISKNDFRNIVQQLTGSPSQNNPPPQPTQLQSQPRPPNNVPKPPSMRLQKIRPPPLTPPIHRPAPPPPPQEAQQPQQPQPQFNGGGQFGQQAPASGDSSWGNAVAESPISAYMRYLQNSMLSPRFPQPQPPPQQQPQPQGQSQPQSQPGLLPTPPAPPPFPSPPPPFASTAPALLPNPPPFPSPRGFSPPLLPSPTSQFLLPSPTGYMSFLSPRSAFPPGSPGFPPLTPTFFSQFSHPGVLGPGPPTPNSPGFLFPMSPSGYFPLNSPSWRNQ